jgi:hypothetical protein
MSASPPQDQNPSPVSPGPVKGAEPRPGLSPAEGPLNTGGQPGDEPQFILHPTPQPPPSPGPSVNAGSANNTPAVSGQVTGPGGFVGVAGWALPDGIAVYASTQSGYGVQAESVNGTAVQATSGSGIAISASSTSQGFDAVVAETSAAGHAAVSANNTSAQSPPANQPTGFGVWANSNNTAVYGQGSPAGYFNGQSAATDAVFATTGSPGHAAVSANNTSPQAASTTPQGAIVPSGFGVWASSNNTAVYGKGNPAGYFQGDVHVTGVHHCYGDVRVVGDLFLVNSSSADIAEDFDLEDDPANAEPGTVLVIHQSGKLSACTEPYDTRVAGVVSGAGHLRPAIVLQHLQHRPDRSPLALVGKALCKVDAAFGGITAGDLLTTSATPGHAMKVANRTKAVGAILGKALHPLDEGCGLVPILVSLR